MTCGRVSDALFANFIIFKSSDEVLSSGVSLYGSARCSDSDNHFKPTVTHYLKPETFIMFGLKGGDRSGTCECVNDGLH